MKIIKIAVFLVHLPFRFSFKHSLASRRSSDNIVVAVTVDTNSGLYTGHGESIPRDYVTGETVKDAIDSIREEYIPRLLGRQFADLTTAVEYLKDQYTELGLKSRSKGASWCALELAVLDAIGKASHITLYDHFASAGNPANNSITYGGVIPFGGKKFVTVLLWFYKLYGLKTVKLKVGRDSNFNLECLYLARKILGDRVILRVDANGAWSTQETIRYSNEMRQFKVASIEQPVPADELTGMAEIVSQVPEQIVADESLCTLAQAESLAQSKACGGFNIRISKVGGILPALEMVQIARQYGVACHMGAQVGESGILTAAGRVFAAISGRLENCEGSLNSFLLQKDITRENLTAGFGGTGKLLTGHGLGVNLMNEQFNSLSQSIFYAEASKSNIIRQCQQRVI